jgi:hypothetical protein
VIRDRAVLKLAAALGDLRDDVAGRVLAVVSEVGTERVRQIVDHGWTPEHDDRHDTQAWAWLLARRVTELMTPPSVEDRTAEEHRRQLVEVAAIACAAIESLDRITEVDDPCPHDPDGQHFTGCGCDIQ